MTRLDLQRLRFRDQFRSLFHEEFQSLIERLVGALHKSGDFQRIRKTSGDGGLDGLVINTGEVYQIYAPARITEQTDSILVTKLRDNFTTAYSTLEGNLRCWSFVHNYPEDAIGKLAASAVAGLKASHPAVTFRVLGIDSFWGLLREELSPEEIEDLFPIDPAPDRVIQEDHSARAARELNLILRRRGVTTLEEGCSDIVRLVDRATAGDLRHADAAKQAEILYWAARFHANAATFEQAQSFRARLARYALPPGTPILAALLLEAGGDPQGALHALRDLDDPDARANLFAVLYRVHGREEALARFASLPGGERPEFLTGFGWRQLAVALAQEGRWEDALASLERVRHLWDDYPELPNIEGRVRVAFLVSPELRREVLGGIVYLHGLRTLEGGGADRHRAEASFCFERTQVLWRDLFPPLALEAGIWSRWLLLTHPDPEVVAAARQDLERSMSSEGESMVRLLPLARARDIPFDAAKAMRYLERRSHLGGLSREERVAEFLINEQALSPGDQLAYLDREATSLQDVLAPDRLAGARIEVLLGDGQLARAKAELQASQGIFDEDDIRRIELRILQHEGEEDLRPGLEANFARTGDLIDLENLIRYLRKARDWAALHPLVAELVRRLPNRRNALELVVCMERSGDAAPDEILAFLDANPDLVEQAPELQSARAWALFRAGRLGEANDLNRQLMAERVDDLDLDLDINLALAGGQWERFSAIVDREWPRRDGHTPATLMRLASIAAQVDVAAERAWDLAKLAVERNEGDAHLLVSAIWLRFKLGRDDDRETASWPRQALALSAEDGPARALDLRTVVTQMMPAQREHRRRVEEGWLRGELPLHQAAIELHVPLSHLLIGIPRANRQSQDGRQRTLVPILSEHSQPQVLPPDWVVGLDITSIFVLAYLELLDRVLAALPKVCVAADTLLVILNDRNQVRHQQPALVRAAERLREMLDRQQLRDAEPASGDLRELAAEVGGDLAQLLLAARTSGGSVVRPLPIYRPASLMEELAVLGADEQRIWSTVDLELALYERGYLDAAQHEQAQRYLLTQDRPGAVPRDGSLLDRPLYLDDLAVTYLQHAQLLEPMIAAGLDLRVHPSLRADTNRMLDSARHGDLLAATLDQIRGALRSGIEAGKIRLLPRRDSIDGQQLPGAAPPTLLQFDADTGICDAICIDDRAINRYRGLTDKQGRTVPVLCVLDLVQFLVDQGVLTAAEQETIHHRLREAGFCFVPLAPDELVALGSRARWPEAGDLVESAELRTLRQSLARVRAIPPLHESARRGLGEALYPTSVLAIRELWQRADLPSERAAQVSDWIWHHVAPSPHEGLSDARPTAEHATEALVRHTWGLLQPLPPMGEGRLAAYREWVEAYVLRPRLAQYPGMVEALGRQAGELIERWTSEPMEHAALFARHLFNSQPQTVCDWLRANFVFRPELGLRSEEVVVLRGLVAFHPEPLFEATRRLLVTREPQALTTADGRAARLVFHDEVPAIDLPQGEGEPNRIVLQLFDTNLFAVDRAARLHALDQVLARFGGMAPPELAALRAAADLRELTVEEIHQLLSALENALVPHEHQVGAALADRQIPLDELPPPSFLLMERYYGPDPGTADPETYLTVTLPAHRQDLLRRDLVQGLRTCLRGALRDELLPGLWLAPYNDDEVWNALEASHPEAEPISLLAAVDVALHRQHDPRFAALLNRALPALVSDTFPLPCGGDFYAVFALLVELMLDKLMLVGGSALRPPFWRRMCAWMEAALMAPMLPQGAVDLGALTEFVQTGFWLVGRWAKMIDRRREPLVRPGLLAAPYVRAELLSRLWRLVVAHQAAGRRVPGADDIQAAYRAVWPVLPTDPLAAHLRPREELPEVLLAQLAGIPSQGAWAGALLYGWLGRLPAAVRASLAASLAADDEGGEPSQKRWQDLEQAALVAVAQRDLDLADAVANALLAVAPRTRAEEGIASLVGIMVTAAAVHEDEAAWAAWLEQRLASLTGRVLPGDPAFVCWDLLQRLDLVSPLQSGITRRAIATASAGM